MLVILDHGELTGLNRSLALGEKFVNDPEGKNALREFRNKIQAKAQGLGDTRLTLELDPRECQIISEVLEKVAQYQTEDFDEDLLVDGNTMESAKKLRDFFVPLNQ